MKNIRLTDKYDPISLSRQLATITRRIDSVENQGAKEDESTRREIAAVRKVTSNILATQKPDFWIEWREVIVNEIKYAEGLLAFSSGWAAISKIEYRYKEGTNLLATDPWTDQKDALSIMTFESDAAGEYPQGGYYRLRIPMPAFSDREKKYILSVQIRIKGKEGYTIGRDTMIFDADKLPDVYSLKLSVGTYSGNQAEVRASGLCDTDTSSIAFAVATGADLADDDTLVFADFDQGITNLSLGNTRFDVSLGNFNVDDEVFVVANAWADADKGGRSSNAPLMRDSIIVPAAGGVESLNEGDITANLLATSAQRAELQVVLAHKGYVPSQEDILTYSGTIKWGDGTTFTLTAGELDAPTGDLHYIFHDPDNDVGDTTISDPATDLQLTTDPAIATQIVDRRTLVGVYRKGTQDGEAAFFVNNSGEIAVTPTYLFAAKLASIAADLGDITGGSIVVGDATNKMWFNDGDDGSLAVGGTDKLLAPFRLSADGTLTSTIGTAADADTRSTANETSITQNADEIVLRAKRTEIIDDVNNVTQTAVKINPDKIILAGDVAIGDAIRSENATGDEWEFDGSGSASLTINNIMRLDGGIQFKDNYGITWAQSFGGSVMAQILANTYSFSAIGMNVYDSGGNNGISIWGPNSVDQIVLDAPEVRATGAVKATSFVANPKPTVTGSRGGNAALASLLTELAALGLITNSTT